MKFLKSLFTTPSAAVVAQRELEEAQREHLAALSASDYSKRIAEYNHDRIRRLTAYLNTVKGSADAA